MFNKKPDAQRRLMRLAISLCALTCAVPALGQSASGQGAAPAKSADARRPTVSSAKPTSPNATINLVNLLVKQGVLTETSDVRRGRVYCARKLLDILEEPARIAPSDR